MKFWDKAWSLVDGCNPVSEGCANCWLKGMSRFDDTKDFSNVHVRLDRLKLPLKTKKPTVFAIWSDLFHEKLSWPPHCNIDFFYKTFEVIRQTPQHTYIAITKRPQNAVSVIRGYFESITSLDNFYVGVTVENQARFDERVTHIFDRRPAKLFLMVEPMLGPIDIASLFDNGYCNVCSRMRTCFDCEHYVCHGVIIGGETGKNARPLEKQWVVDLVKQCKQFKVPVYFKAWGGRSKNREVNGVEYNQLPWERRKDGKI